jgi:hypothetical protein
MYEILQEQGIPQKLIRLIRMTMMGTNSQVQLQGGKTDAFEIHQGLTQGDGLAPMLFNLVLD